MPAYKFYFFHVLPPLKFNPVISGQMTHLIAYSRNLILFILSATIIFSACTGLDGAIEKRKNGNIYLVNKSTSKIYRFTVKETKEIIDSTVSYSTQIITLSPGEEENLGGDEGLTELEYSYEKKPKIYLPSNSFADTANDSLGILSDNKTHEVIKDSNDSLGLRADYRKIPPFVITSLFDTIIHGKRFKYALVEEKTPLPQRRIKYQYEVTGQVEVNPNKKQYFKGEEGTE